MLRKTLLLIWELVPEETQLYSIDSEKSPEAYIWAKECANVHINVDDVPEEHSIYKLDKWIKTYNDAGDVISSQPELDTSIVQEGPFDEVVVCGWYL